MASGEKQNNHHATASWIPNMYCGGTGFQFEAEDDSSVVDSIPLSPTGIPPPRPSKETAFGFSMDRFLSPIMSCVEPKLHTVCSTPVPAGEFGSPSFVCNRAMPERRRPDVLTPKTVRRAVPNPNDVVCGKGHNQSSHQGNRNLRELIAANQEVYASLTKKEKQKMSKQIVGLILLHTEPSGRFLAWEASSGTFVDVGLSRSIEKTNQGFRDALVQSNHQRREEQHQPKRDKQHQQRRVAVQIPEHLTKVYSSIPKPRDILQYSDLMLALKSSTNAPPLGFGRQPSSIPGPFSVTKPNKPPAIVSPREYLPSSVRLAPRDSSTKKKIDFPPGLFTPTGFDEAPFGYSAAIPESTVYIAPGSPRRIHDWKRRRTDNAEDELNHSFESNNSLTEAIESRLTLQERVAQPLPIRNIPKMTKSLNTSADSTDGQAALAATAFLRLDDSF